MEATLKNAGELFNCEEGKEITLLFTNGESYTGKFMGFDDDDTIMLKSSTSNNMIGLPFNKLKNYTENN